MLSWARFYLGFVAAQSFAFAYIYASGTGELDKVAYSSINDLVPASVLIAAFLIVGAVCALAALDGHERLGHWSLVASAALLGFWAGGMLDAYLAGRTSIVGAALFVSLAVRDVIVTRAPFRAVTLPVER
jgi:hypothetical protein